MYQKISSTSLLFLTRCATVKSLNQGYDPLAVDSILHNRQESQHKVQDMNAANLLFCCIWGLVGSFPAGNARKANFMSVLIFRL